MSELARQLNTSPSTIHDAVHGRGAYASLPASPDEPLAPSSPHKARERTVERNAQILRLREQGKTIAEIAQMFALTRQRVHPILDCDGSDLAAMTLRARAQRRADKQQQINSRREQLLSLLHVEPGLTRVQAAQRLGSSVEDISPLIDGTIRPLLVQELPVQRQFDESALRARCRWWRAWWTGR